MAEKLRPSTMVSIVDAVLEDSDLELLLSHYSPELTDQQRKELSLTIRFMVGRAVSYTKVMAEGSPDDIMSVYNAGAAIGFTEGRQIGEAQGYEEGYLQARQEMTNRGEA